MDERYSVEITPFAENALREIGQYIKVNLGSTQNAISTLPRGNYGFRRYARPVRAHAR